MRIRVLVSRELAMFGGVPGFRLRRMASTEYNLYE
jgi:hypothetical protein